ncbi:hypothetical protein HII36_41200 [Nonomuraea sp. NN258]|uniref:hypothetical protein n=1 Tax=Nonomuraea antri TaxID=2730852 RepID=UPI001569B74B|nr:hypothetical protein [Nonomuraea antri]NRQ38204.1 hypothetical protein [Nonomuraea antri]
MRTRKLATVLTGVAVAATTTLVAGSAPAGAVGPCGTGYSQVGVYAVIKGDGTRTGTLEVYYNVRAGKKCALTYGYGAYADTWTLKIVSISRADGSERETALGRGRPYVGPVYVSARGQCIDVAATVPEGVTRRLNDVHCD